ncbi:MULTISPECIES: precorrin-6A reductase [Caloramator]|uniref:Cobalt-precorrin-6x reductase n=1 Tax=Caloramator australicus RC3 TaxID=857293 RepID=I7KVB4_9CLOT|nr:MULTISPECIES: precorrin-6A reductase [Caloramator]MDO6353643.1 precorrin-6A reductase [Caloramator sp. CAR-1]CCJ33944.1 Cobalt-precorrin-6x reductase [Caloramator australicus RC3]
MIWIISGTYEAKKLLENVHGKVNYIATVATDEGEREFFKYNIVKVRLNYEDMKKFVFKNNIDLIVDMSHPFAKEVSLNSKKVAEEFKIEYIRYLRNETELDGCVVFKDFNECADYLKDKEGNVVFTIGSNNIEVFERVKNGRRFIYRILPSEDSIKKCISLGIPISDLVAIKGVFSEDFNEAFFKEFDAKYVVMKDSGNEGGTLQKIRACKKIGIVPLVILRPKEDGIYSIDEILQYVLKW